jgi:PBSX family phage terminase large subunit
LIIVEPHSQKQEDAIFSDAKITALITGIQFGKSTAGALWLKRYLHTFTDQKDNFLVTAPTYKILNQATLPAFMQYMAGFGEADKQLACFKMHNGGTVWFRTSTDPDSVVGLTNVRAVWGDEAGKYSKYFWDNLQARASFRDCPILLTTSPYSLNWIYKELIKGRPAHAKIIGAKSCENPYFPMEEWNRRKENMDPRRFSAIYGGEFERMQGLVYDCFTEENHVIEPFSLPVGTLYYAGIDWGFTDPFVLHIRAITPSGQHYVVGEFCKAMLTITDVVTICKQQREIFGIKTFYCDPSQPANILELNRAGCPAVGAVNDIRHGIDLQYELIRSGRFKMFKNAAPNTLDEFESYHYPEPKELGIDQSSKDMLPVGQDDHCMDAMRYCTVMTQKAHCQRVPMVPSDEKKKSDNPFENIIRKRKNTSEVWQ